MAPTTTSIWNKNLNINSTKPLTINPWIDNPSDDIMNVIGLVIGCLLLVLLLTVIIGYLYQMRMKWIDGRKYYFKRLIEPPSSKQLLYLQCIDLLFGILKYYIMIHNIYSIVIWERYCNAINEESECIQDKYCNIGRYDCDPNFASNIIVLLTLFLCAATLIFDCFRWIKTSKYSDHSSSFGDSCCRLCHNKYDKQENMNKYYNEKKFFQIKGSIIISFVLTQIFNILFFILMIWFCIVSNSPNNNHIQWYTIFPVFVLWIFNEFVIKCVIYRKHPKYDEERLSLFYLEEMFGEHVARIIWVGFLDKEIKINEDETVRLELHHFIYRDIDD